MKTIYIDPETWGPDYLWHPSVLDWDAETETDTYRPTMCCLGFACHQLGATLEVIDSEGLPSVFLEMNDDSIPAEVIEFARKCQQPASQELAAAANKLLDRLDLVNTKWNLESVLARVNDWYHNSATKAEDKLEPTLEVLKLGFKEMGYELVYGKSC